MPFLLSWTGGEQKFVRGGWEEIRAFWLASLQIVITKVQHIRYEVWLHTKTVLLSIPGRVRLPYLGSTEWSRKLQSALVLACYIRWTLSSDPTTRNKSCIWIRISRDSVPTGLEKIAKLVWWHRVTGLDIYCVPCAVSASPTKLPTLARLAYAASCRVCPAKFILCRCFTFNRSKLGHVSQTWSSMLVLQLGFQLWSYGLLRDIATLAQQLAV